MIVSLHTPALQAQLSVHGQTCTCAGGTFRALVRSGYSPTGPEPRGAQEQEHDLVLVALRADLLRLPKPGDDVTIGESHYPVASVNESPGMAHVEIVCRQE